MKTCSGARTPGMPVLQRLVRRAHWQTPRTELGLRSAQPELGTPWALGYRWWVVSPREEPATKVATM